MAPTKSYWTRRRKIKERVFAHLRAINRSESCSDSCEQKIVTTDVVKNSVLNGDFSTSICTYTGNKTSHILRTVVDSSSNNNFDGNPGCSYKMQKPTELSKHDSLEVESDSDEEHDVETENHFCGDDESPSLVNENGHAGSRAGSNKDTTTASSSDLTSALADWAIKFHIPAIALTFLLHILQAYHPCLPQDSRTILKTKVNYDVKNLASGSYYYFGLRNILGDVVKSVIPSTRMHGIKILALQFNVDGLPIFKSSNLSFWSILGKISKPFQTTPFSIALFSGTAKPNNIGEYLKEFIEEHLSLVTDGIQVNLRHFQVKIECFVCDAPARAFLKNIKLHNAYYGCEKCVQKGTYNGRVNKLVLVHQFIDPNGPFHANTRSSGGLIQIE